MCEVPSEGLLIKYKVREGRALIEIKQRRLRGGGTPGLGFENWVRFRYLDMMGKKDMSGEDYGRRHIHEGENAQELSGSSS